jgi:hypothetical protein
VLNEKFCHEGMRGTEVTTPLILNLDIKWSWVISFTRVSLCPRVRTPGMNWIRRPVGGETSCVCQGSKGDSLVLQPVAQPLYPGSFKIRVYCTNTVNSASTFSCVSDRVLKQTPNNTPDGKHRRVLHPQQGNKNGTTCLMRPSHILNINAKIIILSPILK